MKIYRIISLSALGLFLLTPYCSAVWTIDNGISNNSATGITAVEPTASPVPGTYSSAVSITLSASGADNIHYTEDGTAPTCSSGSTYLSAISISSSKTVKAIACYLENGFISSSNAVSLAYSINIPSGGGGSSFIPSIDVVSAIGQTATLTMPTTQSGSLTQLMPLNQYASINVVQNGVSTTTVFSLLTARLSQDITPDQSENAILIGGNVFELSAHDATGNKITALKEKVKVTLNLNLPSDKTELGTYYFDTSMNKWILISDAAISGNTITFYTDKPIKFAVFNVKNKSLALKIPDSSLGSSTGDGTSPALTEKTAKKVLGVKLYAEGFVLRAPDKKMYLVLAQKKLLFLKNLADIRKFAFKKPVTNVGTDVIRQYTIVGSETTAEKTYKDGTLVRGKDKKIYVFIKGKKVLIKNLIELRKYKGQKIFDI